MVSTNRTPEDRSLRARAAAFAKHAQHDPRPTVKKANAAFVASFEAKVDPNGELDPQERARRAQMAFRSHMASLAYRSARARRKGAPGDG
jgi:hypothetical protein